MAMVAVEPMSECGGGSRSLLPVPPWQRRHQGVRELEL